MVDQSMLVDFYINQVRCLDLSHTIPGRPTGDGAVGMVELALERLNESNAVTLDEERKAAMVSNLLVVLCAERPAGRQLRLAVLTWQAATRRSRFPCAL